MQKIIFLTCSCFVLEITGGGCNFYPPQPFNVHKKPNQNRVKNTFIRSPPVIKKGTPEQGLSCKFCEIFKNTFIRSPPVATLATSITKTYIAPKVCYQPFQISMKETFCKIETLFSQERFIIDI